ncbi:MAG: type VI secretion system Vgr family protein [Pseudomonas sp.]
MPHFNGNAPVIGVLNGQSRYRLNVQECADFLDVLSFHGTEALSQPYRYAIDFTCTEQDIPLQQMLRRNATFTLQTPGEKIFGVVEPPQVQKVVHGVVTSFERLSGSADEAKYQVVLEPKFSLLNKQKRSYRFFLNKSVPHIVEQILREHRFEGWEFEFTLSRSYPRRAQVNQVNESDKTFIERLLAEVGIFYTFALQPDTQTEVIHFSDRQSCYQFGKTLPLRNPAGLNDNAADSVWGLTLKHQVVEQSVQVKDYNHRLAHHPLLSAMADMTRGYGEDITYGQVYHYLPRHLDAGDKITPDAETANFWARLDHERFLLEQTKITGKSTDPKLAPGQVLTLSAAESVPQMLREQMVITAVEFSASRSDSLIVDFKAIPYSETLCFRPPLIPRPTISGTLTARITSCIDNDKYAHLDTTGLYWVKFDADRDDQPQGYESMPLRLAKPYGGDTYGLHFPLIQGTEVAIAFHAGDPDRPYIAHALHESKRPDHINARNHTRNVIRTPANNKLRMEDRRGEEHIKLSSEHSGKSQLNLGHIVDGQRDKRGEGAELRSDGHVAVRGGSGVFITAEKQPGANGEMLEMEAAIVQLEQAILLARTLQQAALTAQATPAENAAQLQLKQALKQMSQAGLLLHAPEGVAVTSPKALHLSSGEQSVGIIAGHNTDISAAKAMTVAAGESVSLFAKKQGMKMISANGKVEIQAQSDQLSALALKNVEIRSSEGKVGISAHQELVLSCGGAYIKIIDGKIELGCPGNILLKSTNVQKIGKADIDVPVQKFPRGFSEFIVARHPKTGEVLPHTRYRITTNEGQVYQGITDAEGKTVEVFTNAPKMIKVEFL